jgi:hypothetical protein
MHPKAIAIFPGHFPADFTQGALDIVDLVFSNDGFNLLQHDTISGISNAAGLRVGPLSVGADIQTDLLLHDGDPQPDARAEQPGQHVCHPEAEGHRAWHGGGKGTWMRAGRNSEEALFPDAVALLHQSGRFEIHQ